MSWSITNITKLKYLNLASVKYLHVTFMDESCSSSMNING